MEKSQVRGIERMRAVHEEEIKRAREEDRTEPDWSNTVEMLLRKGVKAHKQDTSWK